jgi:hypothetical protein
MRVHAGSTSCMCTHSTPLSPSFPLPPHTPTAHTCMQATLWNHECMNSLSAFLRSQPHIQSLEVATHDQDLGGERESLAVRTLSQSLPPSATALELSCGVALPLMMHSAAHLPCLLAFKARRLPGKFSYHPGQFPWLEGPDRPTPAGERRRPALDVGAAKSSPTSCVP